jgi:hypothetical protein
MPASLNQCDLLGVYASARHRLDRHTHFNSSGILRHSVTKFRRARGRKTEYDDTIAANGGRYTKRAVSAMETRVRSTPVTHISSAISAWKQAFGAIDAPRRQ